jgi:Holliday junction resolvase RusA-like endonuclease
MTSEGKALKEAYQWEAKSQWRDAPIRSEISMCVCFYFKTKRRRDLDNQNKLVLDALSGIAYEDDSQIATLLLHRRYDKDAPRIEISIQDLPDNYSHGD